MSPSKRRLTVTIDADLLAAASAAVDAGRAGSVSGWVNQALADRAERDRKLSALDEAIDAYEAEHGIITDDELAAQQRADRQAAVVVRGRGVA